ncbi:MAG: phosphoribosylformylglycinamidine synthase I [Patescibacteria group bacterium]
MHKIAIIQFPGLNTEYETRREINRCGMRGEFFRWNDLPEKLAKYDGYVIGGGFSYEDRGRAGIIAALDPIMEVIKTQAGQGKPVLGICNGAQILVESGLIPGIDGNKLAMALARNKRINGNGEILGSYYNAWVSFKCTSSKGSCMFTKNFNEGEIIQAPIAHGEGRFATDIPDLMLYLKAKDQMAFRYCDETGVITDNFPVNPNGAMFNVAALSNPAGNVMAIMPHLERASKASEKLFTSLRDSLNDRKAEGLGKNRVHHLNAKPISLWPLSVFQPQAKSLQMMIALIITDNEAETFEMTLKNLGWPKVTLKRASHIELGYQGKPDLPKVMSKIIKSGLLLNTNKEWATVQFPKEKLTYDAKREKFLPIPKAENTDDAGITFRLLVREKPDFVGTAKASAIQKRLKMSEVTGVLTGTLWEITIPTKSQKVAQEELKKLVSTHLFFNPHRQSAFII